MTGRKVDTTAADVLITEGAFYLFMGGNSMPTADNEGHLINHPFIIPKGVGAYVKAIFDQPSKPIKISAFTEAGEAPILPLS